MTGYRAYRPGTGYTAMLHQNRFTESTHLVHSTLLILGQVDVEASPQNCFNQLVTESIDQVPGYTALILTPAYQFLPVIENYWLQRKLQFLQTDKS